MLASRPRADMVKFQPCAVDLARERKYEVRRDIELRNRKAIRSGEKLSDASQPPSPPVPFPAASKAFPPQVGPVARKVPTMLKVPDDYLFPPWRARLADTRGTRFIWRPDCGNDIENDHEVYEGWEDPSDSRGYLAFGTASIRGTWRSGLLALAFPDDNRLRAEWPLKGKPGEILQVTTGLTECRRAGYANGRIGPCYRPDCGGPMRLPRRRARSGRPPTFPPVLCLQGAGKGVGSRGGQSEERALERCLPGRFLEGARQGRPATAAPGDK